jgi:hypothetical protein
MASNNDSQIVVKIDATILWRLPAYTAEQKIDRAQAENRVAAMARQFENGVATLIYDVLSREGS